MTVQCKCQSGWWHHFSGQELLHWLYKKIVISLFEPCKQIFLTTIQIFMIQDSLHSVYSLGSWFKSFSVGVWILLIVSYVISSLTLFCVTKISPVERGYLSVSDAFWHLIACCFRYLIEIKQYLLDMKQLWILFNLTVCNLKLCVYVSQPSS